MGVTKTKMSLGFSGQQGILAVTHSRWCRQTPVLGVRSQDSLISECRERPATSQTQGGESKVSK